MKRKDDQPFLFSGAELRDLGIAQVLSHNETWACRAQAEGRAWVSQQAGAFTGEDLRLHVRRVVGEPRHPNAWGGLTNTLAVKERIMVPTGEMRTPKDKTSHARQIKVYRRNESVSYDPRAS